MIGQMLSICCSTLTLFLFWIWSIRLASSAGSRLYANNKFIEKIIDELDGETYTKSVGRKNGAEIEIAEMSIKQVT
ncbi:hypothetical protein BJF97_07560 [Klebsiella sp. LTGPAF-6F]|nr:hypothetical protein BJF97_07560 [Klebsiella sp. LTGPAF-6F]